MIPTNLTKLKIEFIKIAKKHDISMVFSNEELIEVFEKDTKKIKSFVGDIKKISSGTKVTDLIVNNQYSDTKGNNILNSKSLYLLDDNYYRRLIGENLEEINGSQISMFG